MRRERVEREIATARAVRHPGLRPSPSTAANALSRSSTPARETPPRGRPVDVASNAGNPLSKSVCAFAELLRFGALDVSWTPLLHNVA